MNINTIFVNPCHGNEPYILGANIAKGIAAKVREETGRTPLIVVPNLYGGRQERIMREEGLLDAHVFLDSGLGSIYQKLLFGEEGFNVNLRDLRDNQETVQSAMRAALSDKYDKYGPISIEINTGAQITSGAPTFLAYPCTYSELYGKTLQTPELIKDIDPDLLEQAHEAILRLELNINTFFIPSYNTFSFDRERSALDKEVPTPPLKTMPVEDTSEIPDGSVYVMLSGTGQEQDNLLAQALLEKQRGRNVIIPPWAPDTRENFDRKSPKIITNKGVEKVIGRAGWGIIWTAQVAKKQFEAVPYTAEDEPEIYFNVKALEAKPMLEATAEQEQRFGTLDGIDFVVREIMKRL